MKNLQKTVQEVITLGYEKALRKGKRDVAVFIPLPYLPPAPPYRTQVIEVKLGQEAFKVRLFVEAAKSGGWVVKLRFPKEILAFNPVIPREVGEALLKKNQ